MSRLPQRRTYRRVNASRTASRSVREQRPDYDAIAADLVARGILPRTVLDRPAPRKDAP